MTSIWFTSAAIVTALAAAGNGSWYNSKPLTAGALHGKVVLVNFWTYSCINNLRPLPYVKAWAAKYGADGLVVIGVHTPEFGFEREHSNVATAVSDQRLSYPIVMDNDHRIWEAFGNNAWPAFYLVDANGRIRYRYFGEGHYTAIEQHLQQLLRERGASGVRQSVAVVSGTGVEAAPKFVDVRSPETYIGSDRAERVASRDSALALNQWRLSGRWIVGPESAFSRHRAGKFGFGFTAAISTSFSAWQTAAHRLDSASPWTTLRRDPTAALIAAETAQVTFANRDSISSFANVAPSKTEHLKLNFSTPAFERTFLHSDRRRYNANFVKDKHA